MVRYLKEQERDGREGQISRNLVRCLDQALSFQFGTDATKHKLSNCWKRVYKMLLL